jgi:phospholipase C
MDRRSFLKGSFAVAGGAFLAQPSLDDLDLTLTRRRALRLPAERLLEQSASDSPIDTIVVVVLENRSFDHILGFLGEDEDFLETGRRKFGKDFKIAASIHEKYEAPDGKVHPTRDLFKVLRSEDAALRGCRVKIPGHTWDEGRAQMHRGFLGRGSGNDEYALTYFDGASIPSHRVLAEHFTVMDHYHASLLGPTFPNRQYVHSATSEGRKTDPGPLKTGIFSAETIWDRLGAAGVPATYYYSDLPILRLWGTRMKPFIAPADRYFEQAAAGTLPNVVMVDPSFGGANRTDAHPRGDVLLSVAFIFEVLEALLRSPQWERSMFVLTYDEWGGFFDSVKPPTFADDRASPIEADNFGQAGFRAATALISPYAAGNDVDHTLYDHTSILRFIEWRFLGAPAKGTAARGGSKWWLTKRDRHAHPIGQTMVTKPVNIDLPEPLIPVTKRLLALTPPCLPEDEGGGDERTGEVDPFQQDPAFAEEIATDHPPATHKPWEPSTVSG